MASAKENGVIDISNSGAASSSDNQPTDGVGMNSSVCFTPLNQRETNPYFRFLDSGSDSGSDSMDSEPVMHNSAIDFFDRESYAARTATEIYTNSNHRPSSTSTDFNHFTVETALGLGIGSGSMSGHTNVFSQDGAMVAAAAEIEERVEELELTIASIRDAHDPENVDWDALPHRINDTRRRIENIELYLRSLHDNDGIRQVFENENVIMVESNPPASKTVVDDLPLVVITSEELRDGNIVCAVCNDEIVVEEKVKRLPCRHYYHGECILPWLKMRNTCPVCRYELPTDDLEYERRKAQRSGGSSGFDWFGT